MDIGYIRSSLISQFVHPAGGKGWDKEVDGWYRYFSQLPVLHEILVQHPSNNISISLEHLKAK